MIAHRRQAVIIGAGLGGLAAAVRLASRGWAVTVCERSATPGGKMNRWCAAGCRFDTGPSLITMPWAFEGFIADIGECPERSIRWIPVRPLAEYVFADGERFVHDTRLPDWLPVVRRLEGRSADRFLRYMAHGARLYELSRATFFRSSPWERPDPKAWRALRYLPLRRAWGPYATTVRYFFRDPHLQQMFLRYPTYVGSSPWRVPAMLSVIPFVEYAFGGYHVEGGLYTLIETLIRWLRDRGGVLRLQTPVTRILQERGRVSGVEVTGGERISADVVIMNGDASRTPALLQPGSPAALPEVDRSLSGVVFLWAIRGRLPWEMHHTVFFSADYPAEFAELFEQRRFPSDPTVYVNLPARSDPSMAAADAEPMFVMANAPANDGEPWDEAAIEDARERVLRRLRAGGFPNLSGRILAESVWTPRRFAEVYDMPGGAIYGMHSHGRRRAFLRPPNRDRRVRGLYYVGGSTHPGGGTPTVVMSARITTDLIFRDFS